ncbi:hypothetical protein [Mesorhizobium sp. 10J20-29]
MGSVTNPFMVTSAFILFCGFESDFHVLPPLFHAFERFAASNPALIRVPPNGLCD